MGQNIKSRWRSIEVLFNPLYMIIITLSSLFNCFCARFFFLGSKENTYEMIKEKGLLLIFAIRFMGFLLFGSILSLGIVIASCLIVILSQQKDWSEPRYVFNVAFICHLLSAFIGSIFFTTSLLD